MALNALKARGFQVEFVSHAKAILEMDFPMALRELEEVLLTQTIPIGEIIGSGGGETKATQRIRRALSERGWVKTCFEVKKVINGVERESQSHEVDHVRTIEGAGVIACEIEWNNKDPFYDRDLENFKRLHAEGAISVGIIITRGRTLQDNMRDLILGFATNRRIMDATDLARLDLTPTRRQLGLYDQRVKSGSTFAEAWATSFVADKYGQATTHWRKLEDRIRRGVGNPCPLLLIGLPDSIVEF